MFRLDNSYTICRPSGFRCGDGTLISELRDGRKLSYIAGSRSNGSLTIDDRQNAAHLIFNSTSDLFDFDASGISARNVSAASGHGVWTHVSNLSTWSHTGTPRPQSKYMNLSVTLCYPAIWTARLNVTLHPPHNRTEPTASSFDELLHTVPDIHAQMGELKGDYDKVYAIRSPSCWRQLISNQA